MEGRIWRNGVEGREREEKIKIKGKERWMEGAR